PPNNAKAPRHAILECTRECRVLLSRRLMPSMQELVAFEAAGRHGNFTKAAEELALTQSAVSKQVSKLEETLGVVLFDRSKGRLVLT
ncbi:helix-turn-helix domain-containing protein, partial [Serratia marcescens]|uniref:helix-turn-helix domain-containing protein n=1 Tax=Serratia marcescens TaxID=615 RepID=UPI003F682A85